MVTDILIPCKSLTAGKSRLAPVCSLKSRERLSRALLHRSIALAQACGGRVAVVSADAAALDLAACAGAIALRDAGMGLNPALTEANLRLQASGSGHALLILPLDLPLLSRDALALMADRRSPLAIAPDRHGSGTNMLRLSAAARRGFAFAFGERSFARHLELGLRRGLSIAIEQRREFGFDLDTPEDLRALGGCPAQRAQPAMAGAGCDRTGLTLRGPCDPTTGMSLSSPARSGTTTG